MACLAFGRAALQSHPSFGGGGGGEELREGGNGGTGAEQRPAAAWDWEARQLTVSNDPARIAAEAVVFESLAQQVTAFICNLDEATVNIGAAEAGASSAPGSPNGGSGGRGSAGSAGSTRSSSSFARNGVSASGATAGGCSSSSGSGGGASSIGAAGSLAPSSSGSSGSGGCPAGAALFRRLNAAEGDTGFGWRERRAAFEEAMQRENRAERLVARCDPAAAERRLQHRLLVAKLEAVAFRGCTGGNSLFDALSLALWGTSACGRCLRALAVSHAAQHPEEYSCFLGNEWQAYLSGMSRPGTPGDELMLRAVSDHFGVPINIVTSDAFMWFQRYAPAKTCSQREVTVAFLGPHTWMPVRKQSTLTALRLTIGGGTEWRQAKEVRRKMAHMEAQPGTPPGLR